MTNEQKDEALFAGVVVIILAWALYSLFSGSSTAAPTVPIEGSAPETQGSVSFPQYGVPAITISSSSKSGNCNGCGASASYIPTLQQIITQSNAALQQIENAGTVTMQQLADIGSNQWLSVKVTNG